jgi:hypothetical protein
MMRLKLPETRGNAVVTHCGSTAVRSEPRDTNDAGAAVAGALGMRAWLVHHGMRDGP